jgi:hypothetical protein
VFRSTLRRTAEPSIVPAAFPNVELPLAAVR